MYNEKSCNALEKPFYTPIEAALRWCNLIAYEADILSAVGDEIIPSVRAFPRWPCLRANAEKLHDAMMNGDLPYGRDGKTVCPDEQVAKHRRTVRHTDLKSWMGKNYPDQKPAFLFDEIERTTHAAINVETFQALQAERDGLKARIEKAEQWYHQRGKNLEKELAELKEKYESSEASAKPSHLILIAAMLELLSKQSRAARNQSAVKSEILERFNGRRGLSSRNLDDIFSAANKAAKEAE